MIHVEWGVGWGRVVQVIFGDSLWTCSPWYNYWRKSSNYLLIYEIAFFDKFVSQWEKLLCVCCCIHVCEQAMMDWHLCLSFWLQGCYVNIDHFKSQVQVFSHQHGTEQPIKRVGNQDWFWLSVCTNFLTDVKQYSFFVCWLLTSHLHVCFSFTCHLRDRCWWDCCEFPSIAKADWLLKAKLQIGCWRINCRLVVED